MLCFKEKSPVKPVVNPCQTGPSTLLTEQEVFHILCSWNGAPIPGQAEARAKLKEMVKDIPGYLYLLPETLLSKIGVRFDHQFDARDLAVATAVKGACERRIL